MFKKVEKKTIKVDKKYQPIIVEWQEQLRSGKYKQAEGQLVYYGKYCCLGVFALNSCFAPIMEGQTLFTDLMKVESDIEPTEKEILFSEFLKIETREEFNRQNLQNTFTSLNDDDELSFDNIAKWIDEHIEFV